MKKFTDLKLSKQLQKALVDLKFTNLTPIQEETFSKILSGKDIVGIAQTGTGKTLAYSLPILQNLAFSEQAHPRVLVVVPTRELAVQVAENLQEYSKYTSTRIKKVYGGTNINTQKKDLVDGADIIVATPGRLYDLVLSGNIKLKSVNKLIIDEVDIMLDLGFRFQLNNIFELLPEKRQNIMFSATMTEEVDALINSYFRNPLKVSIALSGTPLHNIHQNSIAVPNFYTKINLLKHLLADKETFQKVLIFVSYKRHADKVFEELSEHFASQLAIIHANKSQNHRLKSVEQFDAGSKTILVATDVIARGLDMDNISHVINFDTPTYPENYMHRIGRTGRAEKEGTSYLFYTPKEHDNKLAIEVLMNYEIPSIELPQEVELSKQLIAEERPKTGESGNYNRNSKIKFEDGGGAFHEKKAKNRKVNTGGSYREKLAKKYKKSKTKGDKNRNKRMK